MFKGSIVAIITPFKNGKLDEDTYISLIHYHLKNGTSGIVPAGTTGESPTLNHEEHKREIELCVRECKGKIPVIAGTGANSTDEAIKLTQEASDAGADCALLVAPYYNKPPQEGLYQHYKAIAAAVDMPQMLYNVPGRTVVDISQETVERLADIDNIVAIKDATGSVGRGEALIKAVGDRLVVLSGDDGTALDLMKVGAKGNISVTANVAPKAMSETFAAALRGDFTAAKAAHDVIEHLHRDLFIESSPIPAKYALHKMGMIDKGIRLPLVWLAESHHATIDKALVKANLI